MEGATKIRMEDHNGMIDPLDSPGVVHQSRTEARSAGSAEKNEEISRQPARLGREGVV